MHFNFQKSTIVGLDDGAFFACGEWHNAQCETILRTHFVLGVGAIMR